MDRNEMMAKAPIGRLILKLAIPTITAQLINALYNIVERIYLGHIPGTGGLVLTGVGITFPILMHKKNGRSHLFFFKTNCTNWAHIYTKPTTNAFAVIWNNLTSFLVLRINCYWANIFASATFYALCFIYNNCHNNLPT